jgi:hypothetical protein
MAKQLIVAFTKLETTGDFKDRMPVADFSRDPWKSYAQINGKYGNQVKDMSVMQFFMRKFGQQNGVEVLGMRKVQMPEIEFAKHYSHTFNFKGGMCNEKGEAGFAFDLAKGYSSKPLWFFLLYGEHSALASLRGPTDGSVARDPKTLENPDPKERGKYLPISIRGLYGENKFKPMLHMTESTPYGDGELGPLETSAVEAIRFFELGALHEKLHNWPVEMEHVATAPKPYLEISSIETIGNNRNNFKNNADKYAIENLKAEYRITTANIRELKRDFLELSHFDFAAFFNGKDLDGMIAADTWMPRPLLIGHYDEVKKLYIF